MEGFCDRRIVRNLCIAVLTRAAQDYQEKSLSINGRSNNSVNKKYMLKTSAYYWLMSEECKNLCELLNLDYKSILSKLGTMDPKREVS